MDALEILDDARVGVEALCREYGVKRLCPVGLTATGGFDLWAADFQFLCEFDGAYEAEYQVDPVFEFHERLGKLLDGSVDLYQPKNQCKFLLPSLEREALHWYIAASSNAGEEVANQS